MYQLERDLQPFGLTNNDYEILVNLSEADDRRMRMSDLATPRCSPRAGSPTRSPAWRTPGWCRRENCDVRPPRPVRGAHRPGLGHHARRWRPHHVAAVREHFIDLLTADDLAALHRALAPVAEHLRKLRGRT